MFTETIKVTMEQIKFHRTKAKNFLMWIWGLSFLILTVILLFAGYVQVLLNVVAHTYIQTSVKVANIPPADVKFPDFVALINEYYFGYWAVSGFILAILASLGMLKHHTNRMTYFENEVLKLNKLQSISCIEQSKILLANKVIESTLNINQPQNSKVSLNPVVETVTENASKVIDKFTGK